MSLKKKFMKGIKRGTRKTVEVAKKSLRQLGKQLL